jgi:2-oxoglutarate/2-oxoacid ferredoxin oxidoreductase subunit alpha
MTRPVHESTDVVVRFAGDSGDGMQLTGDRFTNATAVLGNDVATLPDFPAEIRAPAGSTAGVSAFQVHFASEDITTPGDHPNVLVAMNPAALKTNLALLTRGGVVVVNEDAFTDRNLEKAGYATNPLDDGSMESYKVYRVPMTTMTLQATESVSLLKKEAERSKNMFALGLVSWMFGRPPDVTLAWIDRQFARKPDILEANVLAFKAGYNFGETTEVFEFQTVVPPAPAEPGTYRNVTGEVAVSWGLVAAAERAGVRLFYSSYPITPASGLLHELAKHKNFGVRTVQAEDEIAAANVALGASFAGNLGVTGTSGPGLDLKAETLGLAVMLELPMVIIDVQRGGPSTGLPTKTEASDLMLAMYGRHGEAPLPVLAAYSPSQSFDAAVEACRIAIKYRTPVILLTDSYIVNSSEPWRIPDLTKLPEIDPNFAEPLKEGEHFLPYAHDENLARPWAVPGTPGLQHRIGGLEKKEGTGEISYDPDNHERMTHLRAERIARIADDIPPLEVDHQDGAELLVLGWGSTYGSIRAAVKRVRASGLKVDSAHLFHLNPFPANTGEVVKSYKTVLIPELNMGQLSRLIRAEFLVDTVSYNKMRGLPILADELEEEIGLYLR